MNEDLMLRIGWAILHSLWQGLLIGAVVMLLFSFVRGAAARHFIGMLALCGLAGLMIYTGMRDEVFSQSIPDPSPVPSFSQTPRTSLISKAPDFSELPPAEATPEASAELSELIINETLPLSGNSQSLKLETQNTSQPTQWLIWLTCAWFIGAAFLSLRHLCGWLKVRQTRRKSLSSLPTAITQSLARVKAHFNFYRRVTIRLTEEITTPVITGMLKPMILIPTSLVARISPAEMEALIAHELAHLMRRDSWSHFLQLLIETLIFYHPVVWWLGRIVRAEREKAADDLVILAGTDAETYVSALAAAVENQRAESQLALAATGGSVIARMHRLLIGAPSKENSVLAGLGGALLLTTCISISFWIPGKALAENPVEDLNRIDMKAEPSNQKASDQAEAAEGKSRDHSLQKNPANTKKAQQKRRQQLQQQLTQWRNDAYQLDDPEKRDAVIAQVRESLSTPDTDQRLQGLIGFNALSEIRFDKATFHSLIRPLLDDPDEKIRATACRALTLAGLKEGDLDQFIMLTKDSSAQVRKNAGIQIVWATKKDLRGPEGQAIARLLKDPDPETVRDVLRILWGAHFSPEIETTVINFTKEAQLPNFNTNGLPYDALYYALSTQPSKSTASVKRLTEILSATDTHNVGGRAAWGLGYGVEEKDQDLVVEAALQIIAARTSHSYLFREMVKRLKQYARAKHRPQLEELMNKPAIDKALSEELRGIISRLS